MIKITPKKIGRGWRVEGYSLDKHIVSSVFIGEDEFGHPQFETKRTELGELLFRYKYRSDEAALPVLVKVVSDFLLRWNPQFDMIIPVPPTKPRKVQPVLELCLAIARKVGKPCQLGCITKVQGASEMKNIKSRVDKNCLLKGKIKVDRRKVDGKKILLFDDLYDMGATLSAIAEALFNAGAKKVLALTITRTGSEA